MQLFAPIKTGVTSFIIVCAQYAKKSNLVLYRVCSSQHMFALVCIRPTVPAPKYTPSRRKRKVAKIRRKGSTPDASKDRKKLWRCVSYMRSLTWFRLNLAASFVSRPGRAVRLFSPSSFSRWARLKRETYLRGACRGHGGRPVLTRVETSLAPPARREGTLVLYCRWEFLYCQQRRPCGCGDAQATTIQRGGG